MNVLLPTANDGLPALERRLAEGKLSAWLAALRPTPRVEVSLPKWKASSARPRRAVASDGHEGRVRVLRADFSEIDDARDLFISAVVHQAVVGVDEEGTGAAAATAVMVPLGGLPPTDPPVHSARTIPSSISSEIRRPALCSSSVA